MKRNSIFLKMKKLYGFGFLSLALLTSSVAVAQDVTTGLKLYYSFNAVSGASVTDDSGNNMTGTINGSPTVVVGNTGNALNFPLQADFIQLPNDVTTLLTDFTVAAWIKLDQLQWWPRIFDFGTGQTNYMFLAEVGGTSGLGYL